MIKLVKNPQGEVVAFGGHEGYEPVVPEGFTLELVESYTPTPTPDELAQQAKVAKYALLNTITVTTSSGKVFDGDEVAIARMTAAIIASDFMGITEAEWKLADDTKATVSVFEVKEALALAIQRVGEIVTK